MKKELEDKLYSKYPKIFKEKDLSIKESCMPWGITCGDGWYNILDITLNYLSCYSEQGYDIIAEQVKQKFGSLRFYYRVDTEKCNEDEKTIKDTLSRIETIVHYLLYLSTKTCEKCGSMNNVTQVGDYVVSLCEKCRAEREGSYDQE